jgi:hypothetical protein
MTVWTDFVSVYCAMESKPCRDNGRGGAFKAASGDKDGPYYNQDEEEDEEEVTKPKAKQKRKPPAKQPKTPPTKKKRANPTTNAGKKTRPKAGKQDATTNKKKSYLMKQLASSDTFLTGQSEQGVTKRTRNR